MTGQSSHGGLTVGFEEITPALAREYLGKLYTGQRSRYAQDVQKLAGEMVAGRWEIGSDCVTFDVNDELINGQNRLSAIVESDTTQWAIVYRGAPTKVYEVIDQPRVRSLATVLTHRGEKNVSVLGGALNLLLRWSRTGSVERKGGLSPHAQIAVLDEHPGLRDSVLVAMRINKLYDYSGSNIAVCHYLFGLVDKDSASGFFDSLELRTAPEGSPVWLLQGVLMKRRTTDKRKRYDDFHYLALIIKAWNAHMAGTPISTLRRAGGEPWPTIFDPYGSLEKLIGSQA